MRATATEFGGATRRLTSLHDVTSLLPARHSSHLASAVAPLRSVSVTSSALASCHVPGVEVEELPLEVEAVVVELESSELEVEVVT